jgi:hypothetical protein
VPRVKAIKPHDPWASTPFDLADAMSLKALAQGTANEDQQKRALSWVVNKLCRINRVAADPQSERATYFTEGKRYVGLHIARIVAANPDDLKREIDMRKED